MEKYNINYLRKKGFFEKKIALTDKIEDSKEIEYVFDPDNKLAYFDSVSRGDISEVMKTLKRTRNFDYYWFWDEARVCCFRTFGEYKRFIYNLDHSLGSEWVKGKEKKLREFSSHNPDVLFKYKDVVEHFYKRLWDLRIALAESTKAEISDNDKIMHAQRIIDRLIFLYFLGEKGIIRAVDSTNRELNLDVKELFKYLLENSDDFHRTLNTIFFDYLNSPQNDDMPIDKEKGFSLHIPYLNGGLFRQKQLNTINGKITELDIRIEGFDWSQLVKELNDYNWIIDDYSGEEEDDVIGNLTPEILGHIYEKFVISVSKSGEIKNLQDLRTTEKGELKIGNKKVGAYYTPGEITNYIANNTIFPFVREKLGLDNIKGFDAFFEDKRDDPDQIDRFDQMLSQIKILDPAVGSGHFLMSAAHLLFNWRRKSNLSLSDYDLRRDIIINNLYGVDIMDGAVEICKLRLWLWLISSQDQNEDPEPLPNIDFNILQGNSLIGFTKREIIVDDQRLLIAENLKDELEEYRLRIDEYKHEVKDSNSKKKHLQEIHDKMQHSLNKWYAQTLDIRVEENVAEVNEVLEVITTSNDHSAVLVLEFQDSMNQDRKNILSDFGFTTYTYTARLDLRYTNMEEKIRDVFKEVSGEDLSKCVVERRIKEKDLERMNIFHWVMEFPHVWDEGCYDVILGNPPHGNILSDIEKEIISSKYPWGTMNKDEKYKGSNNAGTIFTERCYDFEKPPNRLGFVLPSSVARVEEFQKFRHHTRNKLEKISEIGKAFRDVGLEQIILILSEDANSREIQVVDYRDEYFMEKAIPRSVYDERDIFLTRIDMQIYTLLKVIEEDTKDLLSLCPEEYMMPRGITVESSKYHDRRKKGRIQVLGGTNILPFALKAGSKRKPNRYLKLNHKALKDFQKNFPANRVIYQNVVSSIPHVVSTFLPFELPTDDTVNNLITDNISPKALVVLLNSKLVTFYLNYGIINCSKLTVHLDSAYLGKIPIKKFDDPLFIKLSETLLFLQQSSNGNIWQVVKLEEKAENLYREFLDIADLAIYELYLKHIVDCDFSILQILHNHLEEIAYEQYMNEIFRTRENKQSSVIVNNLTKQIIEQLIQVRERITNEKEFKKFRNDYLNNKSVRLIETERWKDE